MARQDDRQKPMNLDAKSIDGFNTPNTVTTLTGNVTATQGTLKMTGAKGLVSIDANTQISHIHVIAGPGKLAHIEQIDDAGNLMTGDADTLDYDNINGIAVLTGHAVVHQQGRGESHGDKLIYNTQTQQMTGTSGSDGQVHMVLLPKPQPAAGPKPASAPPAPPSSAPSSKQP
ncbi:lipopolysaccharide transport periplasmic protein LptA [Rhodanobacter sp. BL-MT-08]